MFAVKGNDWKDEHLQQKQQNNILANSIKTHFSILQSIPVVHLVVPVDCRLSCEKKICRGFPRGIYIYIQTHQNDKPPTQNNQHLMSNWSPSHQTKWPARPMTTHWSYPTPRCSLSKGPPWSTRFTTSTTLPETNSLHVKISHPKRNPLSSNHLSYFIFRCYCWWKKSCTAWNV